MGRGRHANTPDRLGLIGWSPARLGARGRGRRRRGRPPAAGQETGGRRHRWCGRVGHPGVHRRGPAGAAQGRHRGRRGGRRRRHARRHRPLRRRSRRRWLLRLLRRAHPPGVHDRRSRDDPAGRQRHDVRRPGDRPALPVPEGGDQRTVRRRAGHARHLGARAGPVGPLRPRRQPEAGHQGGRPRVHCGRHVPRADPPERDPLPPVRRHERAVPARRPAAGGRLDAAQPGPRRHLPGDRPPRSRRALRRLGRPRHGRRGTEPAGRSRRDDRPAARPDDRAGPQGLPRDRPPPGARRLPRATTCTAWRRPPAAASRSASR